MFDGVQTVVANSDGMVRSSNHFMHPIAINFQTFNI